LGIGHLWAGRAFGTNTGNLFVRLTGEDSALSGTLHLNDPTFGLTVYHVKGEFNGETLSLSGNPENEDEDIEFGTLSAQAKLSEKGEFKGEWATDTGSRGTFVLFPHDQKEFDVSSSSKSPEQLHTARHNFGAIALDKEQIISLATVMQAEFPNSQVVVTLAAGTEQTRLLNDFRGVTHAENRAESLKLFVQEAEPNGINRVAIVEFGPQYNLAMAQGSDEAWTLGMLEKLKRYIQPLERTYTTHFKRFGFGVNQFLIFGAIVYLPSLQALSDRFILMLGVLFITFIVNWLHQKFLPYAAIYLTLRSKSLITDNLISWTIAFTSAFFSALLVALLEGWF